MWFFWEVNPGLAGIDNRIESAVSMKNIIKIFLFFLASSWFNDLKPTFLAADRNVMTVQNNPLKVVSFLVPCHFNVLSHFAVAVKGPALEDAEWK